MSSSSTMWRARAYGQIEGRQQVVDRLVHTEAELRKVLDSCARGLKVGTIRLGADILVTRPIVLDTVSYDVVIDGGNRYGISVDAAYADTSIFTAATTLGDGIFVADISLHGCTFTGGSPALSALFDFGTIDLLRVNLSDCTLTNISSIVPNDGASARQWLDSHVERVRFTGLGLALGTVGSAVYKRVLLAFISTVQSLGTIASSTVDNLTGSTKLTCIEVTADSTVGASIILTSFGTSSVDALNIRGTSTRTQNSCLQTITQKSGTTTNATPLTLFTLRPEAESVYLVTMRVLAFRPATGDSAAWYIHRKVKNTGGVTGLSAAFGAINIEDVPTTDPDAAVSGTDVDFRVTGNAAETWHWQAEYKIDGPAQ